MRLVHTIHFLKLVFPRYSSRRTAEQEESPCCVEGSLNLTRIGAIIVDLGSDVTKRMIGESVCSKIRVMNEMSGWSRQVARDLRIGLCWCRTLYPQGCQRRDRIYLSIP